MITPEGKALYFCSQCGMPSYHLRLQLDATPEQADPGGEIIRQSGQSREDLDANFQLSLLNVIQDRFLELNIELTIGETQYANCSCPETGEGNPPCQHEIRVLETAGQEEILALAIEAAASLEAVTIWP